MIDLTPPQFNATQVALDNLLEQLTDDDCIEPWKVTACREAIAIFDEATPPPIPGGSGSWTPVALENIASELTGTGIELMESAGDRYSLYRDGILVANIIGLDNATLLARLLGEEGV